ncbi:MAG: tRNA lysidine(34) synthetase TilS [Acidimicrobiales bacterium]
MSGGADSLALLVLAVRAGLEVTAVHVDHGIRAGSAAEADRVADAAGRFGARFRSVRVRIPAGGDLEQRARHARRAVLGAAALTGHTADDQAETVLINLMRGTGPWGLAAMTPGPPHPLLALRRHDTEAVCAAAGLAPFHDPSNDNPRFVRNRVRHELLPLMAEVSGRDPVPLLSRTADHLRATAAVIDAQADALDPQDTRALGQVPAVVATAALRRWLRDEHGHPPSAAELERVMAVVHHRVDACELAGGRRLSRHRGRLALG